ncbi:MAG: ion transporter [Pararhodobacter sp.]
MRGRPGLSWFNQAVIAGILVLILIAVLETEVQVIRQYGGLMQGLHGVLFVFFLTEYLLRLWVAPLNPRFCSHWRFMRSPSALLDLIVLITFITPFLGLEAMVFRLLQLTRILRLARLGRYSRAMNLLFDALRSRGTELVLSAVMAVALMLAAATLLYLVERDAQPEAFGSIPRAMWWAVATLTTVGYGDVTPVTVLGRFLAALTALCGIGIIALPAGVLAGAFSDAIRRAREEQEDPQG